MGFFLVTIGPIHFIICFILFLIVTEIGFRIGHRVSLHFNDERRALIDSLQTSMFGLLALLLAFTFSMAVTRYDTRKQLVLREANAIGSMYSSADLFSDPERSKIKELLRKYVDYRLDFYTVGIENEKIQTVEKDTASIQRNLWDEIAKLAKQNTNSVLLASLVNTLIEISDIDKARIQALNDHIPAPVLLLLIMVAMLCFGFIGYRSGAAGERHLGAVIAVALALVLVIVITLDIDRPRRGLIKISQDSLTQLKKNLDARE